MMDPQVLSNYSDDVTVVVVAASLLLFILTFVVFSVSNVQNT
jgi:hypothetical protein